MLAPFISVILGAMRWLTIYAVPVMLSSFVVGLLIKIGVAVTSFAVIAWAAEYLRDFANSQLASIGSGELGASVMALLSLFGIFEGISLIVSCYLAKATWLSVKPSLTWLTPPAP